MGKHSNYRKINDGSCSGRKYHKKDGTPIRTILKRETEKEANEYLVENTGDTEVPRK